MKVSDLFENDWIEKSLTLRYVYMKQAAACHELEVALASSYRKDLDNDIARGMLQHELDQAHNYKLHTAKSMLMSKDLSATLEHAIENNSRVRDAWDRMLKAKRQLERAGVKYKTGRYAINLDRL